MCELAHYCSPDLHYYFQVAPPPPNPPFPPGLAPFLTVNTPYTITGYNYNIYYTIPHSTNFTCQLNNYSWTNNYECGCVCMHLTKNVIMQHVYFSNFNIQCPLHNLNTYNYSYSSVCNYKITYSSTSFR